MMGVAEILKDRKPDLVLSGVNRGSNIADDVTYSGTIAGAMEGTALGIRSIALSQAYGFEEGYKVRWHCAETHGPSVIKRLVEVGWPEPQEVLMNVNFPDCEPEDVTGIEVTEQGKRDHADGCDGAARRSARAIPISGSGSSACAAIRAKAPICAQSMRGAFRSRRCI